MGKRWRGVPIESNGSVPVNLQDQHTEIVMVPISIEVSSGTQLAAGAAMDTTAFALTPGHGAAPGNIICIKEDGHFYHGTLLTVVVNDVTMDTPLDYDFTASALTRISNPNLAVDGSVGVVTAFIQPPPATRWDITRIHVHITDNVIMDSSQFGGIAALTKGVVVRMHNGIVKNVLNVKSNRDLSLAASFYAYDDKAPAGFFGFTSYRVLAGQEHVGVTMRLDGGTNEQLRVLIQDDLTALEMFVVYAIGHVVTD